MKILDYIIVAVVIVWFLLALRNIRKKKGGCCCSCGHTENVAGQKHAGKKIPAKNVDNIFAFVWKNALYFPLSTF